MQQDEAAYAGFLQVRGPLNVVVDQVPEDVPLMIFQELKGNQNPDSVEEIFDLRKFSQIDSSMNTRKIRIIIFLTCQ